MQRTRLCIAALFLAVSAGCNSEPDRLAVSGSIRLDGKAIGNCTLVFKPLDAETVAFSACAAVMDGKFEISKANGLAIGEYGVVFTELQPDLDEYEASRAAGSKIALNKKFIPPKYTVANELRVQVAPKMQPISLDLKSK